MWYLFPLSLKMSSPSEAMLVCSLPMKSQKRLALSDTSATHGAFSRMSMIKTVGHKIYSTHKDSNFVSCITNGRRDSEKLLHYVYFLFHTC